MRASLAIILSVLGVVLASVLAIGALNQVYFDDFLVETYDGRLLATATNLRNTLTQGLALGLPLRDFEGGGRAVDDAAQSDALLRFAAVYDRDGDRFVALRGTTKPGNPLPPAWARAMRRDPTAAFWQIASEEGFGVLLPVVNAFDRTVALIALIEAPDAIEARSHDFGILLGRIGLATTLPLAILLVPAALWAVRPAVRRMPDWQRFARAFARARADGDALPLPPARGGDDALAALLHTPYERLRRDAREVA